jgi:hypothetical protein
MTTTIETLTPEQQREYVTALRNGLPALSACNLIGVPYEAVLQTEDVDADFAEQTLLAGAILSQNAAAALYKQGLNGSVSALTFLLRNQPPPEWTRRTVGAMSDDELDNLSPEELERELARMQRMCRAVVD